MDKKIKKSMHTFVRRAAQTIPNVPKSILFIWSCCMFIKIAPLCNYNPFSENQVCTGWSAVTQLTIKYSLNRTNSCTYTGYLERYYRTHGRKLWMPWVVGALHRGLAIKKNPKQKSDRMVTFYLPRVVSSQSWHPAPYPAPAWPLDPPPATGERRKIKLRNTA